MERPTRRSATAANGLSAASNGTATSSGSSSRRRRREADPRDSGAASDGGDTDSSTVAVEMGARTNKASASKNSARAAKGKSVTAGADGHDADHRSSGRVHEDHREDADSEDPTHDDDAHANASAMVKLSQGDDASDDERAPPDEEDAVEPAPPVVAYATRARRERSQSVVSTASDSASSIASTRHGAEEEEEEDEDEDGAAPRTELHGEKLAELEKKKKMVEEGTLAEYCRRVAEFKEERNRLLQSAEWHKNLQLKNTADLHGFEVQRAHNIWLDSKEKLKSEMLARADALLAKLRGELATLEETKRLPTHVVAPKKSFVLPPRKAPAPATTPATGTADAEAKPATTTEETDGVTTAEATPRHSFDAESKEDNDGAYADEEEAEAEYAAAPLSKRRKTVEGSAPVPSNVLRLPLDDISSDLASIMGARETASAKIHTALPAAQLELRVDRRRLLCGKYVFEEGDEVVVTAAVLKEDYIGVISSVSEEEVYVKLSTGQKVRVAVDHIAFRRCEIRPFLRGSAGIESLQTSGWVECEPF